MLHKNIKNGKILKIIEKRAEFFVNNKLNKSYKKIIEPDNGEFFFTLRENLTELNRNKKNTNNYDMSKSSYIHNNNTNYSKKDSTNTKKQSTKKISDILSKMKISAKNNFNEKYEDDNFEYIPFNGSKNSFIQNDKNTIRDESHKIRIDEFKKIVPKFTIPINGQEDKIFDHKITNSEFEMMETDEKLPQKDIDEIGTKRNELEISNTFPFHFFIEKEKCYQALSKDLKGNGNKNIEYKKKIAASFLKILLNPEYPIYNIISNNKDLNKFCIRELCFYLLVLFLNDFNQNLNEDNISDLLVCIGYCHLNFLFIVLLLVNKTNEEIYRNSENLNGINPEVDNSYFNFKKCSTLIELNSEKVDIMKYELNFHGQNKIIKNILINFLTNLSSENFSLAENILNIINLSKNFNLKRVINEHILNNKLIIEKIDRITNRIISPENILNNNDDNINFNNIKSNNNENNDINLSIDKEDYYLSPLVPFLPLKPSEDKRDYCLVLDLDETLVHYIQDENDSYVIVRHGTEKFIKILSEFCEIVIFTGSKSCYADSVIDGLEVKNFIDHRLYRQHTTSYNGYYIKDLSKLGRPLNKIIIIDNIEENYQLQMCNGLNISNYEGEDNDFELEYLLKDLLPVVQKPGKDIYTGLINVRKAMQKRYTLSI